MRQVLENLQNGNTIVDNVPCPLVRSGHLLIQTHRSVISAGTERVAVEFGRANWLDKARQQPEKVRQVLDKVCTDGFLPTIEAVQAKLDTPIALGYCNVGTVIAIGAGVIGFAPGDRVASNGPHAEVVCVPAHLCAKVPDSVDDDTAAFTVLVAIALQGIRLAQPTLGERLVVIGLGLLGLITVQILRANGCQVLAFDLSAERVEIARRFGAEAHCVGGAVDPVRLAMSWSCGVGVDGVLLTVATKSDAPVQQAAQMCRKRGRIVLVGVTGLTLSRADFYEKELSFQVSCSYGPGRYDASYEEKGHDYPIGFVRWTEQRNFQAVLGLMADGRIDVESLITHRFPIASAAQAYDLIATPSASLGIVLEYPLQSRELNTAIDLTVSRVAAPQSARVGYLGAGGFSRQVLLPALMATGAERIAIVSNGGVSCMQSGRKFGFALAATDKSAVFADDRVNTVFVATRHDSHAALVCEALTAKKHVFVEKPLGLTGAELDAVETAYRSAAGSQLMVGFNRRFAPLVQRMKSLLTTVPGPKSMIYTVNAGAIPAQHWTQDSDAGGGRIIGEVCHFLDLLRFLAASPIIGWDIRCLNNSINRDVPDTISICLSFADGSIGTIHYFSNGSKSYPKEQVQIFADGRILVLDNFCRLTGFGWLGFSSDRRWRQDKGHRAEVLAFISCIREGKAAPIPATEIFEISRLAIEISQQVASRKG